ncbi:venom protease-like [Sitodiplosis mosellana]|uniref:venom protease-like n=1 Tax=Sitodiplosis mosellana TaxID=263140 RepID=UPI0024440D28|nr:venom protease-like [Sitodiplosis mosellana]
MADRFLIVAASIILLLVIKINARDEGTVFCQDPNQFEGACKHIKECSTVLNELVGKSYDNSYRQYIRQSNAICDHIKPLVCCPSDGRRNQLTESSIQGRLLTPSEGCGFSNQNLRLKSGDKKRSRLGAFPWMALISYTDNLGETSWKCGGSLITTRHVLTSARCATPNLVNVRLGEYNFSSYDASVQDLKVIRTERHPNYNERDGTNDIAILYLERDVHISPRIRPTCLPTNDPIRSRSFVNYRPFLAGWDLLKKDGRPSNFPYEQQLTVLENESCKERYRQQGELASENQFNKSVLCVGFFRGSLGDCQSDLGSPLLQPVRYDERGDFRYYQIGIASYGFDCEKIDTPAVYTSVQYFIDWIQERINS